jgi:hypothetical protein
VPGGLQLLAAASLGLRRIAGVEVVTAEEIDRFFVKVVAGLAHV